MFSTAAAEARFDVTGMMYPKSGWMYVFGALDGEHYRLSFLVRRRPDCKNWKEFSDDDAQEVRVQRWGKEVTVGFSRYRTALAVFAFHIHFSIGKVVMKKIVNPYVIEKALADCDALKRSGFLLPYDEIPAAIPSRLPGVPYLKWAMFAAELENEEKMFPGTLPRACKPPPAGCPAPHLFKWAEGSTEGVAFYHKHFREALDAFAVIVRDASIALASE